MNYVELAIPFFILAMALEYLYGRAVKRQTYRLNDTVNSLAVGVLSRLVDVLRLSVSAFVLGAFAVSLGVPQWSMSAPWQWAVAFVAYDFCYYWKHRCGHEWRIMWASHVAHHQSEEFNLSTALRQSGTDFIGFLFYLPLYLAGIPPTAIITVGSLNLIYQFWVHTEHIGRLGPLEWILVTPSNHRVHHARNACYIDRNYGGVFIVWDRLFRSFQDERADERCTYGITKGLKSWNPLWANFHSWSETLQLAWRTRYWADRCKIWFKPPDWYPRDIEAAPVESPTAKFDPPLAPFSRAYVFVQFWLLTFASLWLLKTQGELPRTFVLAAFVWLCGSLYVQGVWLEGRAQAKWLEWLRLAAAFAVAMAAFLIWPKLANVAFAMASYAALSTVALAIEQALPTGRDLRTA